MQRSKVRSTTAAMSMQQVLSDPSFISFWKASTSSPNVRLARERSRNVRRLDLPCGMLSSSNERSGKRRRSGRAAPGQAAAAALKDASPIARPGRRGGSARDGEASSRSPAQGSQARLTATGRPPRRRPFVRTHPYNLRPSVWSWSWSAWFGGHCSPPLWARAALTASAPGHRIPTIWI
jgi:hypothetical protein